MATRAALEQVLADYLKPEATDEDRQRLYIALQNEADAEVMRQLIEADSSIPKGEVRLDDESTEAIRAALMLATTEAPVRKMFFAKATRWIAAAVVLFAVATTFFLLNKKDIEPQKPIAQLTQKERFKNDIQPGKTGAILRLSNGREILLDTAKDGQLFDGFTKGNEGIRVSENAVQYATVITPKARIQTVQLSDGTTVWLNAGSSVKFPTVFNGNTREVEITGEVYFEVAKNKDKPFIVNTGQDKITVLGTHFNVNTYAKQVTTLLEGSVKINNDILKPGQQYSEGKFFQPDIESVMAWKDGRFLYDGAGIKQIMQDIERWYDVDIEFKEIVNYSFVAKVNRNLPVSELLKILEATGDVHFTIEGKKISVFK
ncbi:DUF4974 domain-containing protein [Sediminibacterium roseum]|uniref:DUF4974 domain-containing protein n=1 Tax=Sediminibacterium roseum TaxID=1978412 RepID=A0ABW9ZZ78_9BACT|nr:FecR family protein [Sediminibacterium roseum]NCI51343.1 DUF4974 domain-containing protein [Sediminibacterium roseum]